jgi:diguanylate cyclase (GGDEF)-like protein
MQAALRQKLETCRTLPSLPPIAVHVLRLCQRDNFDLGDVARAINSDPALARRIVGLVNTPLFMLKQEAQTVSQTLMLLGVNAVRTIALSFSIAGDMRAHERTGVDRRGYWRRAIFGATAAHFVARLQGLRHPEEAFLGGLLQDVGMLAIEQAVPEAFGAAGGTRLMDHDAIVARENEAFACDHAEVGRWLTTQWRLPEAIRAMVGGSHDPERWQRGLDDVTGTLVRAVALSGSLADVWVGPDPLAAARRAEKRAAAILGLDREEVTRIFSRLGNAVLEIAPLFDCDVGKEEDVRLAGEEAVEAVRNPGYRGRVVEGTPGAGGDGSATGAEPGAPIDGGNDSGPIEAPFDPLTGLASRARFDAYLTEQFEFATRVGKPLSVILVDIDHLDMMNQTFGHQHGDEALAGVGRMVGERLRHRDLAARYGGEEFALILVDTHSAGATVVGERVRKRIEEAEHQVGLSDPVRMTVSVGCATLDESLAFGSPAELLQAVERALAEAKRAGRNRVVNHATYNVAA